MICASAVFFCGNCGKVMSFTALTTQKAGDFLSLEGFSPSLLKAMTISEKKALCLEIRKFLVSSVQKTGGHLSANLGTVELSVALHSVFESPRDKIIWDVGHQAYTHKILTGRAEGFSTLRKEGGISGFPKPSESEHDAFIAGHSSISVSAALGIAQAKKIKGEAGDVIAVIGDGAFTGGEAYEGFNNAGKSKAKVIVVLNDNGMSISKNTGALPMHLAQIRSTRGYYKAKKNVKTALEKTPVIGKPLDSFISRTKGMLKGAIYHSNIFEDLGFQYIGPVDGHNIEDLIKAMELAKFIEKPCVIHVYSKKGKGYCPAEENPGEFHSVSKKSAAKPVDTFSEVFGRKLAELGGQDKRICAITAAMKYATGLQHFAHLDENRFFDVGIAEQHGFTFAGGLASQGMLPVFAVYSTFMQRGYDQLIHDLAISGLHVVLGVDRAGFVGEDGETHQGMFDVSMLSAVPNVTVFSPANYAELELALPRALYEEKGVVAVRYPRGGELFAGGTEEKLPDYRFTDNKSTTLVITYGRISAFAERLCGENSLNLLRLIKLSPLDDEVFRLCAEHEKIFVFEEALKHGGVGERLCTALCGIGFKGEITVSAVDGEFVKMGTVEQQLARYGLDFDGMKSTVFEDKSYAQT